MIQRFRNWYAMRVFKWVYTVPVPCSENGVKWYRTGKAEGKNGAWGFADENSEIALHLADNAKDEMDAKRLSLHVNDNGQWQGAHRSAQ